MKILHLHLRDCFGNPRTLTCHLNDGSIQYKAWAGHGPCGTRVNVNNLCPDYKKHFPIDNPDGLTLDEFKDSILDLWSPWRGKTYGPKIEGVVQNKVEFK
tara:strand:+ start:792 stop:1091 length:300 start_codon:yes stop_codon:yes gene_type:complete